MWWWLLYGDRRDGMISGHTLLMIVGFSVLLIGAFFFQRGSDHSQWPVATARILSVEVKCRLSYSGGTESIFGRGRNRSSTAIVVGCDQVEQFRRDNAGRNWSVAKVYNGRVEVTGEDRPVTVSMTLSTSLVGGVPRMGGRFELAQNPNDPSDVRGVDRSMSERMLGGLLAGLGVFLLAIGFFWL